MFFEQIELRGHIIDSLLLPKVLDEILTRGGNFTIREIQVGKQRDDASYARIEVYGPSPEVVDDIVRHVRQQGAEVVEQESVRLVEAPADGVFPPDFYVTTNQKTFVHYRGQWLEVRPVTMDCAIAVDEQRLQAEAVKFAQVQKGRLIAVGHHGIRVAPRERPGERRSVFEFMGSSVSSEKPKSAIVREVAAEMRRARESGGRILVVAGPAIVHTGAGEHFEKLVAQGYVNRLFAGNALAVHDIENALFGTSLGVYLERGSLAEKGHENHMRAINAIRGAGGIAAAVAGGILRRGIFYQCVKHNVDFVLAGSIRDDGPLPEVITDTLAAQKLMRARLEGVTMVLMMCTMLHSIAVGNLLPAHVKTICVDINPAVVTKLSDRGTFQAVGLVTDIEPFLRELTEFLAAGESPAGPV
ncbi:MAG TPA: TIGR00300 family protein [Verrucomicrobiota bacterium]|jgi:lysine-ketoglutarate reductase/saccharopine dehydrogenase-like protein (TIGR00300 family)|nr:TIGR00300 family protein [Verrucomicrobiota bacterium]HOH39679.1 TIGR00300 family protein [Verrucomicrobiota bacterium]